MTEDEAKTKFCPHVRLIKTRVGSGNLPPQYAHPTGNGTKEANPANCIGSACMAWRETVERNEKTKGGGHERVVIGGYCGLSGAPQ